MVSFRNRGEDDLGQTAYRANSRRGRVGGRRRQTVRSVEMLEDRTLLSFTPIAQPGDTLPGGTVYTAGTTNMSSVFPADFTRVNSIADSAETVSFSDTPPLVALTVPTTSRNFGIDNWNSPPATESDTPRILADTEGDTSLTLTLSKPATVFGFEMQVVDCCSLPVTATFMDSTPVGSIPLTLSETNNLPGQGGAMLFAASTNQAFTSVAISYPDDSSGFAIAQVRYALSPGPLTGTSGNEITGVEGSSTGTTLLGTFADADQASTVADFASPPGSVVVTWGDGSAPQTVAASKLTAIGTHKGVVWTINAARTYTEEGTYQYTVTVTSVDGAATTVDGSAIIADAPLTAGTPVVLTPNTGVAAPIAAFPGAFLPADTVVATFTDANTFATTADFRTNIDWGDGSPTSTGTVVATATPGLFDVIGGPSTTQPLHLYARAGDFTTKVTVVDDGGSQVVVASLHGGRHRPGGGPDPTRRCPHLPAPSPRSRACAAPLFVMATFEKTPTRWPR